MNKKKLLLAFAISAGLLAGCGSTEEVQEAEPAEIAEPAPEPEEEKEAYAFTLGSEEDGEYPILLKNETDAEITSFSLKGPDEEEFGENLMAEDDAFDPEVTVLWYASQPEDSALGEYAVNGAYEIRLSIKTDEEETEFILHSVSPKSFDSEKECSIRMKENVVYLVYTNTDGEEIDTFESEKAALQESEEPTEADESYVEETEEYYSEEPAEEYYYEDSGSYDYSDSYTYETPSQDYSDSSTTVTPSGSDTSAAGGSTDVPSTDSGSSEGCLGGIVLD